MTGGQNCKNPNCDGTRFAVYPPVWVCILESIREEVLALPRCRVHVFGVGCYERDDAPPGCGMGIMAVDDRQTSCFPTSSRHAVYQRPQTAFPRNESRPSRDGRKCDKVINFGDVKAKRSPPRSI